MNTRSPSVPLPQMTQEKFAQIPLNRRKLIGAGALAGGLGLYSSCARSAQAQGLSGTIRVGYESSNTGAVPLIEATAEALQTANPDATIELEPGAGGGYATQLVLQLSTGSGPDIFYFTGLAAAELAAAGVLSPLESYAASWDGWEQYPEVFRQPVTYNGSVWGMPGSMDTHFIYYRRDIFEQAGLSPEWQPERPASILEAASAIRESGQDVIPYALYAGANGGVGTVSRGFLPLVYAFGGQLKDEQGLWIIDSCAIRAALEYYHQAYQTDQSVPQDVMTGASPATAMREAMGDGGLGILYEGSWTYGPWYLDDPDGAMSNIGFSLFPTDTGASPFAIGGVGNCWYMNARCASPDLGWAFISAFNSKDNQVALNVTDPHIPARSDAAADPAFQANPFLQAMVATVDNVLLTDPDPALRQMITIIQNATGIVASGEVEPDEAVERYMEELTRVLGEEHVVRQPCNG